MTFNQACEAVISEATGMYSEYAKTYAEYGKNCPPNEQKVQALYILSNLEYWRGERAREVKAALKRVIK
jgi:hypothetical protein